MEIYRYKKIIIGYVILITLIELCASYYIFDVYAGIYQIYIFILLVLIQPFYCIRVFKEKSNWLLMKSIGIVFVSIVLPLVVFITLPAYTYIEGKQKVEIYADFDVPQEFINIPMRMDTIPTMNNPKQVFVSDRLYYYGTKTKGTNRYFIVNPITGEVQELSEPYWQ